MFTVCFNCFLDFFFKDKEDPNTYLKKRPLTSPVLLLSPSNCLIALGNEPVCTFSKGKLSEAALYLMAFYYALHLTYPKCVSSVLSVIQTEVLLDKIHDKDLTPTYKKALSDWRAFVGQWNQSNCKRFFWCIVLFLFMFYGILVFCHSWKHNRWKSFLYNIFIYFAEERFIWQGWNGSLEYI